MGVMYSTVHTNASSLPLENDSGESGHGWIIWAKIL